MASEAEGVSDGYDSDVIWSENPEMAYFKSMIEKGGDQDSLAAEVMNAKPEAGVMSGGEPRSTSVELASLKRWAERGVAVSVAVTPRFPGQLET